MTGVSPGHRGCSNNLVVSFLFNCTCLYMSHSTKMKEFGRNKSKKITQLILILFHLKLDSKHLTTIIHSLRQENSNNNNFRFILMAAHVKNVIPVTTTMNLIS